MLPQALITGRPVVSFDVDGAREVVIPDATGFLVPPGDIHGLTSALEQLIQDGPLRERLGAEGRRRFAEQFRHQRMTERLRALYVEILKAKGRGVSGEAGSANR